VISFTLWQCAIEAHDFGCGTNWNEKGKAR
jgi:hypothetical protein